MREGECVARLRIESPDALHIVRAVQPDNRETPPHIRVSCQPLGGSVECIVVVEGCRDPKRIMTLRNTVDDLLLAVRAAVESLDSG